MTQCSYSNTHPIIEQTALEPINPRDHAIVTGLYTDAFATAVATLGHTLNKANASAERILFYLPEKVSTRALCIASVSGFRPHKIERIPPPHPGVHSHFLDQYSKLRLWTLDKAGYKSVVYLDADTLVRGNFDELFRLPFTFGAVPDVYVGAPGYTVAFNAGVLFLRPSSALFEDMVRKIATARYPTFEAEQSFLNHYFGAEVLRLPYVYNGNVAVKERTPALWAGMQAQMRVVHYTLAKPFLAGDYELVPMDELEKNAERVARKKPVYREEVEAWAREWRETRERYKAELAKCT